MKKVFLFALFLVSMTSMSQETTQCDCGSIASGTTRHYKIVSPPKGATADCCQGQASGEGVIMSYKGSKPDANGLYHPTSITTDMSSNIQKDCCQPAV